MYVYIIQSQSTPTRDYVGITTDLAARLEKHNTRQVPSTTSFRPWKYKNAIWFSDKETAHKFERYLKTGSGRAFRKTHFSAL